MGTKEEKIEKYRNLWVLFEELLKSEDLNLSSFAKKWDEHHDDENSEYHKFFNKIKKQEFQVKSLKSAPQDKTVKQIEKYIKFLDNKTVFFEALDDEKFGNIF